MKTLFSRRPEQDTGPMPLGRRSLVVGAGIAGTAAVATHVLRSGEAALGDGPVRTEVAAAGDEGYRLTPHVLRYYETTRS